MDYDYWESEGAAGWGWHDVLPFFKRLETDLDYSGPLHGDAGPMRISRSPQTHLDDVTRNVMKAWSDLGSSFLEDLNGEFGDGHGPVPSSNDRTRRYSTSIAYLTSTVRDRPNLEIMTQARALRVVIDEARAVGGELLRSGEKVIVNANRVVVCAGAVHSPHLLLHSGIGDAKVLADFAIPMIAHRPGVGQNLQDHPIVSISGYLAPRLRSGRCAQSELSYMRYSSNLDGCESSDMVLSASARTMWHAVGQRICTLRSYIALPYSRGKVSATSGNPLDDPNVDMNGLSDERDLNRMVDGFQLSAKIMLENLGPHVVSDVFPSSLSRLVARLSEPTLVNEWLAKAGAAVMDASPSIRAHIVRKLMAGGKQLVDILVDRQVTADHVRSTLGTSWHVCGTCRMGRPDDEMAVVDPACAVIGVSNLFVVDASVMPRIPRTNTNLPVIMISEKVAAALRS